MTLRERCVELKRRLQGPEDEIPLSAIEAFAREIRNEVLEEASELCIKDSNRWYDDVTNPDFKKEVCLLYALGSRTLAVEIRKLKDHTEQASEEK